jgi:hypothetical protein
MGLHETHATCCFKVIWGKYCRPFCATAFTPNQPWNFQHVALQQGLAVKGLRTQHFEKWPCSIIR